jgi:hypothetical protein
MILVLFFSLNGHTYNKCWLSPLSLNFFLLGSSMGDKADWSDGFLRNLFDARKEEIEVGNRPIY